MQSTPSTLQRLSDGILLVMLMMLSIKLGCRSILEVCTVLSASQRHSAVVFRCFESRMRPNIILTNPAFVANIESLAKPDRMLPSSHLSRGSCLALYLLPSFGVAKNNISRLGNDWFKKEKAVKLPIHWTSKTGFLFMFTLALHRYFYLNILLQCHRSPDKTSSAKVSLKTM